MAYPDTAWHENTPVICPVARLDTRGHGLPQNQKRTKVSKCAKFVGLFFYFGQRVHQISTRGECLIGKLFKVGMGVGPSIQTRVYKWEWFKIKERWILPRSNPRISGPTPPSPNQMNRRIHDPWKPIPGPSGHWWISLCPCWPSSSDPPQVFWGMFRWLSIVSKAY